MELYGNFQNNRYKKEIFIPIYETTKNLHTNNTKKSKRFKIIFNKSTHFVYCFNFD